MNRFLDILNDKNHFVKTRQGGLFYRPKRRMVGGMIREDEKKTSPTIDEIEEKIQEEIKAMNEIMESMARDQGTIVKLRNREADANVKAMNEIMESMAKEEESLNEPLRKKIEESRVKRAEREMVRAHRKKEQRELVKNLNTMSKDMIDELRASRSTRGGGFKKGSKEAKEHMARLRAMRKK